MCPVSPAPCVAGNSSTCSRYHILTLSSPRHLQSLLQIRVVPWPRGSCSLLYLQKLWPAQAVPAQCVLRAHSFLSSAVAAQLPGVQRLSDAISVQVANGNVMHCSTHLPAAVWKIQNYHFSSDLRILPLQHFDLILGMDWLESFSPMKVH